MKTKIAAPKKEGQKRGTSAQRRTQAASELAIIAAASHTAGLLGQSGAATMGEATPEGAEATQAEAVQSEAAELAVESGTPRVKDAVPTDEPEHSVESALPAGSERSETAVQSVPVAFEDSAAIHRTGVIESPLARRMRAEAAQRRGKKTRASHRGLGAEFEAADNRVKSLQTQFEEVKAKIKGSEKLEAVAAQITEVRGEIRASRGAKVEGVEKLNDDIAAAREALKAAKQAKADFLAENGLRAAVAEDGQPSLRQRLKALRAEKEALLEAGGGEGLAKIRADLKAAKAERKTACEKATDEKVTAAREEATSGVAPESDSQAQDDARDSAEGGQQ